MNENLSRAALFRHLCDMPRDTQAIAMAHRAKVMVERRDVETGTGEGIHGLAGGQRRHEVMPAPCEREERVSSRFIVEHKDASHDLTIVTTTRRSPRPVRP